MATTIVTRAAKGAALTHTEMDANLVNLQATADEAQAAIVPDLAIGNIMNPLLHMPLKNDLKLVHGVGAPTFTRASTATYIDRYGIVQSAAIDVPRFEKEGLLMEGASTNKALQSEDFTTSTWVAGNTVVNSGVATAPDGVALSACEIKDDTANNVHYIYQGSMLFTSGTQYSFSLFVKRALGLRDICLKLPDGAFTDNSLVYFDLSNGSIISALGAASGKVTLLDNNWYRCEITAVADTTITASIFTYLSTGTTLAYTGDATSGLYVWGAQVEELPFASSYIPTTTAAVTRATERLSLLAAENIPVLDQNNTILFDSELLGVLSTDNYMFGIAGISTGWFRHDTPANQFQTLIGDTVVSYTPPSLVAAMRVALTLAGTTFGLHVDGTTVATVTQATLAAGVPTTIYVGASKTGSAPMFGHISNFRIYDRALTAEEVKIA